MQEMEFWHFWAGKRWDLGLRDGVGSMGLDIGIQAVATGAINNMCWTRSRGGTLTEPDGAGTTAYEVVGVGFLLLLSSHRLDKSLSFFLVDTYRTG